MDLPETENRPPLSRIGQIRQIDGSDALPIVPYVLKHLMSKEKSLWKISLHIMEKFSYTPIT